MNETEGMSPDRYEAYAEEQGLLPPSHTPAPTPLPSTEQHVIQTQAVQIAELRAQLQRSSQQLAQVVASVHSVPQGPRPTSREERQLESEILAAEQANAQVRSAQAHLERMRDEVADYEVKVMAMRFQPVEPLKAKLAALRQGGQGESASADTARVGDADDGTGRAEGGAAPLEYPDSGEHSHPDLGQEDHGA